MHNALNCSILVATLADKSTPNRMPKFPERPKFDQKNEDFGGMSEERLKAEREKAYYTFKIWADSLKSSKQENNK